MSAEPGLVDANVLVYSTYRDSAYHRVSRGLLDRARSNEILLYLTPQVLAEFYAVVTNPRRVSQARAPAEALDAIDGFLGMPGIRLLPVPVDVVARRMALLRQHPVTGPRMFDVQIVATMLGNGIDRLYTFNLSDFVAFSEIRAVEPSA